MAFDPINEIALEMKKKMEKILAPGPALCITNGQGEIKYIDTHLENRRDYIQNYVKDNFSVIEEGQYAHPVPSILLAFFRMGSDLMFVLFLESGKIGSLLLYRGLLETYATTIQEVYSDLQMMEDWEKNANLVLKLTSRWETAEASSVEGVIPTKEEVTSVPAVAAVPGAEVKVEAPAPTTAESVTPEKPIGAFPKLLEKFRNKKFNFMEGLILQQCRGELTTEEICKKTNYSKGEVTEIIDKYQQKGWLIMLGRRGAEIVSTEELPAAQPETATKLIAQMEDIVKSVKETAKEGAKIYPQLLEKYRGKKFGFKEGIILQFCDGKRSIEEIVTQTKLSEEEVLEVVNAYQQRGWLVILTK